MKQKSFEQINLILPVLYVIFVSIYMLYHRTWFSPDQFFAVAIIGIIFQKKVKTFLGDWVPILLFLFGYEYLRGLLPYLTRQAHILPMIIADKAIFGFIPAVKLQHILYNADKLQWYDYLSVILYTSHFIIPMLVAFIFWQFDRKYFKSYTTAFLILSYMAFFTFLLFPAAPPWLASTQGYIQPLNKIMDSVYMSFAHPISVPSIYQFFGANLVAAVPSLHAAYPWLIFLSIRKKNKQVAYIILPYVAGVWFSVLYLGEHYFIDIVAGILYAWIAFMLVQRYQYIKEVNIPVQQGTML